MPRRHRDWTSLARLRRAGTRLRQTTRPDGWLNDSAPFPRTTLSPRYRLPHRVQRHTRGDRRRSHSRPDFVHRAAAAAGQYHARDGDAHSRRLRLRRTGGRGAHRRAAVALGFEGRPWRYAFAEVTGPSSFTTATYSIWVSVRFTVRHTPGPHAKAHLLRGKSDTAEEPVAILTGDFVFVSDVPERPDLLERAANRPARRSERAPALCRSAAFASSRTICKSGQRMEPAQRLRQVAGRHTIVDGEIQRLYQTGRSLSRNVDVRRSRAGRRDRAAALLRCE